MRVKSDATFKSSLKYTAMPKNQEKNSRVQRRLQFNENDLLHYYDYEVSSPGLE